MIVSEANFLIGNYDDGTPIPDNALITVDYGTYTIDITYYSAVETTMELCNFEVSLYEFRDSLGVAAKGRLDEIYNLMEVDADFLRLCPNVTAATLDASRDAMRIIIKDFYINVEGLNVHSQPVLDGLNFMVSVGLLTQSEKDSVMNLENDLSLPLEQL